MEQERYEVGKYFQYSQIPEVDTEEMSVAEYGQEYIGQHAIHIRYHDTETDVWFVWHGQGTEGIFKCVYNN